MARARKTNASSQPFYVAEQFTGFPGITTPGRHHLLPEHSNGEADDLPESAFMYVGNPDEARQSGAIAAAAS